MTDIKKDKMKQQIDNYNGNNNKKKQQEEKMFQIYLFQIKQIIKGVYYMKVIELKTIEGLNLPVKRIEEIKQVNFKIIL